MYFFLPVFSNFLLVSTGFGSFGRYSNTEVLNLDSKDVPVPTYQNHSEALSGTTGGFVGNQFITCGGFGNGDAINECYKIGTNNSSFHGTMKEKRENAASIMLADRIWVLGGHVNYYSLKSTEYILHDGRQKDGPDLPIGLSRHAAIQMNHTHFMILGGLKNSKSYNKKTWFYSNGNWMEGPSLRKAIWKHSVGKLRDSVTHKEYIVVTGGIEGKNNHLNSTEILAIDGTSWEAGIF